MNKVIFEGEVLDDSWLSHSSDPTHVVFDAKYSLPPIPIFEVTVTSDLKKKKQLVGYNDFGLIHLALPGNYKVKRGQKKVITLQK